MNRRGFLNGVLSTAGVLASAQGAGAYNRCAVYPKSGRVCEAGIDLPHTESLYDPRHMPQWCWAASIELIFRHYGYRVPQAEILQETFGGVDNVPAVTGLAISQKLDRDWTDRRGRRFRVRVEGLFDPDAGMPALNNAGIVAALAARRPLLMGSTSHAMVLSAVAYVPPANIVDFGLVDPWPGVGVRGPNSPAEMIPVAAGGTLRYLCLPRVTAV